MSALQGRTTLQVIPDLSAGGAERTTLEIAEAVVNAGGRAIVASRGGRLEGALKDVGGELIRMDAGTKNPMKVWGNAGRLARFIRRENVSLIHARSRAPAWSAYWAAMRTRIPFVTTYHGAYNARSGLKRTYNSVMARGKIVIANSDWIAEHIRIEHGVPRDRIVTIPRGVDLRRFDRDAVISDRVDAMRTLFGIARSNPFVILMPARMTRWKGQPEAIRAMAGLTDDVRARSVLILVGDAQGRDDYVDELIKLADREGVKQNIRILGHCDDIPAAMMASDLMIAPSIEPEAFGRSIAEASAMGLPVVATDHGGARETVLNGRSGLLVPPASDADLSAAIERVFRLTPAERIAMGEAGRAYIRERFSTRALQEATLNVYQSLLDPV